MIALVNGFAQSVARFCSDEAHGQAELRIGTSPRRGPRVNRWGMSSGTRQSDEPAKKANPRLAGLEEAAGPAAFLIGEMRHSLGSDSAVFRRKIWHSAGIHMYTDKDCNRIERTAIGYLKGMAGDGGRSVALIREAELGDSAIARLGRPTRRRPTRPRARAQPWQTRQCVRSSTPPGRSYRASSGCCGPNPQTPIRS